MPEVSIKDLINYHVVPPVFLVFFTLSTQYLASIGNPTKPFELSFILGNYFAWKCVFVLFVWALVWLKIPSKKFYGPTTSFGYSPEYQANGELYYLASTLTVVALSIWRPQLCVLIYENMGAILGALNITALSLCLYLLVKAKLKTNENDPYLIKSKYPVLHEFYRGMELHPRLLGVDVKQLTNCRMGMIMWQLLIIIYFTAGWTLHGFNFGHSVNVLLQTVYTYKFFHWETGYFNTLDITLDRAGYYLCWGCLVWIPAFYAFHSYFFVYHEPNLPTLCSGGILVMGLLSIWFNYDVDRQKEAFRTATGNKSVMIWGRKAEFLKVSYKTADGKPRESKLLLSGWWKVARKINYSFELLAAFSWSCLGGFQFGVWPYLYFLFLFVLLVHRIFRDESKCMEKYGQGWRNYCKQVPYRLIPFVF